MKYLLIPLLFLISCSSCKKEVQDGPATLIGTWLSDDNQEQWAIKSTTKDEGRTFGFLEINKDRGRYLRVRYEKDTSFYLIKGVTKYQLLLQDSSKKDVSFHKIAD